MTTRQWLDRYRAKRRNCYKEAALRAVLITWATFIAVGLTLLDKVTEL
jgi:hypothetical protein